MNEGKNLNDEKRGEEKIGNLDFTGRERKRPHLLTTLPI